LPIETTVLKFQEEELQTTQVLFRVPGFSFTKGVALENPVGSLVTQNCSLSIKGVYRTCLGVFDLELSADLDSEYKATTSANYNQFTLKEVEDWTGTLYEDPVSLLPNYNETAALEQVLYGVNLVSPRIYIEFSPEASVVIEGSSQIFEETDSSIKVFIGRVNSLVECYVLIESIYSQSMEKLLNFEHLRKEGFELGEGEIITSTGEILNYSPGIFVYTQLEVTQTCQYSDFCNWLLKPQLPSDIQSEYYPSNFKFTGFLNSANVSDLHLYDSEVALYIDAFSRVKLQGFFDLQGDSYNTLTFLGEFEEGIYLNAFLTEDWLDAFEIQDFSIQNTKLTAKLDQELAFEKSSVEGTCVFGGTWKGDIKVYLSSEDYIENYFSAFMEPTNSSTFFGVLTGEDNSLASYFEFPWLTQIDFAYKNNEVMQGGFSIYGKVKFLGLLSVFETETQSIPSDLKISLHLPNFTSGYNNIKFHSEEDTLDLEFFQNSVVGSPYVDLWSISNLTTLSITEDLVSFFIWGNLFQGEYQVFLELESNLADFNQMNWTAYITLFEESLAEIQTDLETKLQNWIDQGLHALSKAELDLARFKRILEKYESRLCNEECGSVQQCQGSIKFKCLEFGVGFECSEQAESCTSSSLECSDFSEYSEPVVTCQEWTRDCTYTQEGCNELSLKQLSSECLRSSWVCNQTLETNLNCLEECEYWKVLYEENLQKYQELETSYSELQNKLGDFKNTNSELAIYEVYSVKSITQSGIGPQEFNFKVDLEYFNLEFNSLTQATVTLQWNFFNKDKNHLNILKSIQELIIQSSQLTQELLYKTPFEVYLES